MTCFWSHLHTVIYVEWLKFVGMRWSKLCHDEAYWKSVPPDGIPQYLASPRHILPLLSIPRYFSDTGIPNIPSTHAQTEAHWVYNPSHAINYSYGWDKKHWWLAYCDNEWRNTRWQRLRECLCKGRCSNLARCGCLRISSTVPSFYVFQPQNSMTWYESGWLCADRKSTRRATNVKL